MKSWMLTLLLFTSLASAKTETIGLKGLKAQPELMGEEQVQEKERQSKIKECQQSGDINCLMDNATPKELKEILGPIATGSARTLKSGESIADFKVKIRVYLRNPKKQYLEVDHPGGKMSAVKVSGGRGGFSNPIRNKCFVPNISTASLLHSKKYKNSPMYDPLMFIGRSTDPDPENGMVYGIHGTDKEHKLGEPDSMGCVRVSKKDAATIRGIVNANGGKDSAVICID